ncbi:MAG: hypothetical protein KC476_10155 [Cyanobacteria bacterium HKST-UBA06]|nr:hypothetical protein [Cyanobacteria bacterium HKST-UBA06]
MTTPVQPYGQTPFIPMPMAPLPMAPLPMARLSQLGQSTRLDATSGLATLNTPLLDALSAHPLTVALPLARLLATSPDRLQVVEGLALAQRLAMANRRQPNAVLNTQLNSLFMATSRFHRTPDPLIQVYLAGFYRYLSGKAAYGPLLELFWQNAQTPDTVRRQWPYNPNEEIGGSMLEHVAGRVTRQLLGQLSPETPLPLEPEV